jgi:hypothetical protein
MVIRELAVVHLEPSLLHLHPPDSPGMCSKDPNQPGKEARKLFSPVRPHKSMRFSVVNEKHTFCEEVHLCEGSGINELKWVWPRPWPVDDSKSGPSLNQTITTTHSYSTLASSTLLLSIDRPNTCCTIIIITSTYIHRGTRHLLFSIPIPTNRHPRYLVTFNKTAT